MAEFAVIGLGNFGYYLAVSLHEKGHEVLAIDPEPERVQEIRAKVTQAVVADATDRKAVEELGLSEADAAVVCIGSDMSVSLLAVLNLVETGTPRVLAMAISEAHARVLGRLGISEVLFPEKDLAAAVAEKLHNPNLLEYLPCVEGYGIIELKPPREFVGRPLRDLDLINRFRAQVIAIKGSGAARMNIIPTAHAVVKEGDLLILLGPSDLAKKLRKAR